ncbi:MAG TPA: methyltransferase regulatory domain-containing protein [Bryobacteraceae bacterium]|nr:methyltransferase regulatory domain-containing protein [Bryobacteraceae bacterium]
MPTLYDELPYPGLPFAETHPERLAILATLFGMTPAPVDRCRVLELGCGDAGNLLPMAFELPDCSFTGIDLAGSAIARGQELAGHIGLTNLHLQQLDLLEFDSSFGEFDYIIAHGLYSWVPPQIRERILEICKTHLAQNGVAYISYNAYPGGHLRDAIRRMMQFHVRGVAGIQEKCRRARALLEFLVEARAEQDIYHAFLRSELQSFLERSPTHFFHDELSECNNRFYFYEFVRDASRHGLQYLSEARLLTSQASTLPPDAVEKMLAFSQDDELVRQQYLDFVKLRNFRQSLLCHSTVQLQRRVDTSRVKMMLAASVAKPASAVPDISSPAAEEFRFPNGGSMSTNHPLAKAAILHLGGVWPAVVSFSNLLHTARSLVGRDSASASEPLEEDSAWLSDLLLKLYAAHFVELHMYVPACSTKISAKPVASALVRAQLRTGHEVTNLRHASVSVDDESGRILLSLLDGTRDRAHLLAEMSERCEGVTAERLESSLEALAKMSLLVA